MVEAKIQIPPPPPPLERKIRPMIYLRAARTKLNQGHGDIALTKLMMILYHFILKINKGGGGGGGDK